MLRYSKLNWRCNFAYIAAFFFMLLVQQATAQQLTADAIASTSCGTPARCCYAMKFTTGNSTDELDVTIWTGNTSCWDETCFNNQTFSVVLGGPAGVTPSWYTDGNGNRHFKLLFSPALGTPAQVEFTLCPSGSCNPFGIGLNYTWQAKLNGNDAGSSGTTHYSFNGCPTSTSDCFSCDRTVIYAVNDCYQQVCYKRRSGSNLSSGQPIKITFDPALKLGCTPACQADYGSTRDFSDIGIPTGWSVVTGSVVTTPDLASFEIVDNTAGVLACAEVCITIPKCTSREPYKIKMSDKNNPNDCTPVPIGYFKRGEDASFGISVVPSNESNYPNPLTGASDFRTMIPFTIDASGEARITIVDESGRLVHTETELFEGAGKHFFFFSGSVLSSGTYYYTIESPLGVLIVKRSLLIVK